MSPGLARQEQRQRLLLLAERAEHRLHALPWAQPLPLRVHGHCSRAELLAAFGLMDGRGAPRSIREGVLWDEASQPDLLFLSLRKGEPLISPSTR